MQILLQWMDTINTKCQINGKIITKSSCCDDNIVVDNEWRYSLKANAFCHNLSDIIDDNIKNNILMPRRFVTW